MLNKYFKGTVREISSDPQCKDGMMPDLQRYPGNLNLSKNVEETVVFNGLKACFFSCEFLHCFLQAEKSQMKINNLKKKNIYI